MRPAPPARHLGKPAVVGGSRARRRPVDVQLEALDLDKHGLQRAERHAIIRIVPTGVQPARAHRGSAWARLQRFSLGALTGVQPGRARRWRVLQHGANNMARMSLCARAARGVPSIAVPVCLVGPVNALVAQHERVDGVVGRQDRPRGAHLRVEHGVRQVLVAFKNAHVALQQTKANLRGRASRLSCAWWLFARSAGAMLRERRETAGRSARAWSVAIT